MGKLRDLLDEAKRQRQAYEAEGGINPWGLLGDAAQSFTDWADKKVHAGVSQLAVNGLGMPGDLVLLGRTVGQPIADEINENGLFASPTRAAIRLATGVNAPDPHTQTLSSEWWGDRVNSVFPGSMYLPESPEQEGFWPRVAAGFTNIGVPKAMTGAIPAMLLAPERARKGNLAALAHARQMQADGRPLGDITRETYKKFGQGIEIDPVDNTAGFEISEIGPKGIKLKQTSVAALRRDKPDTLGKVIDYPELWENHPEWQNIPVRIVPGEGGSYNKRFNYIELGEREWLKNPVKTIKDAMHEVQHLADDDAGRSIGGNPYMPELAPVIKSRRAVLEKKFEKETTPLIDRRMALASAYGIDRSKWPKEAAAEDARIEARLQSTWNTRAEEMGAIPRQAYMDLRGEQRARLTADRYGMTIEEMIQWPRSEFETEAARKNSIVLFDSDAPRKADSLGEISVIRAMRGAGEGGKPRNIQILTNPTADEVARFAGREIGTLRTMTDPKTKTTWVWNAEDALHYDVASSLVEQGKASEKVLHLALRHKGGERTADVIAQLKKKAEDANSLWSKGKSVEGEEINLRVVSRWDRINGNPGKSKITVLKNPTEEQVKRFAGRDITELRSLWDQESDTLFVWDAAGGYHADVAAELHGKGLISDMTRESTMIHRGEDSPQRLIDNWIRPLAEGRTPEMTRADRVGVENDQIRRAFKAKIGKGEALSENRLTGEPLQSDEFDLTIPQYYNLDDAMNARRSPNKRKIRILKNPSYEDVKRLEDSINPNEFDPEIRETSRDDPRKILRALADREGNVYVWDASQGIHARVADALYEAGLMSQDTHSGMRWDSDWGTLDDMAGRLGLERTRGHKTPNSRNEMWSEGKNDIEVSVPKWAPEKGDRKVTVLRNPSQKEVDDLVKRAVPDAYEKWDSNGGPDGEGGWSVTEAKILRVIVDHKTGDKFVWDASDGIHQHIFDALRKGGHTEGVAKEISPQYNGPYGNRYSAYYGTYEDLVAEGALEAPTRQHKAPKPRDEMFSEGRLTDSPQSDEFDVKFRPVWGDENAIAKTRVLKNPTVEAIKALDAKKGELRALVDRRTGDVYVWDGYEAFHDDVLNSMVNMGLVGRHDARSLITPRDVTQSAVKTIDPNELEGGGMLRFGRLSGTLDVIGDRLNINRQHKAPKPRRGDEFGGKPAPILLGSQAKGLADTPEDFPRPQFPDLEEPRQLTRASVRNEGTKFAGAPAHVTSEAAEDAAVDSYLSRVLAGIPAMNWYLTVSRDLLKMSGNRLGVADHLAGSLGPTSAHTALAQNAQTGMRGYYQGVTGNPVKTATGLINSRIEELFQGMVEKYGPKINPYVHHLRGEWEPPPNRAVHDIWDRRAWGYSIDKAATEAEHRWMDLATAKAVKKANDTKLGGIDNWTPEKLQAAAWAVMKAEELGIPPGELAGGYLPELDRLTGHFRIETNPGVKNPVSGLPEAGQDAYMRSVLNNILTPEGQLAPFQQAGGITPPNQTTYIGAGDWEGTHSKVASTPFIGSLLGGQYEKKPNGSVRTLREGSLVLAPEFRELADSVAATVGMLLGQKGVGYDLAREANRIMDVNAVRGITGGRQLTGDDIQKMNDYLKSKGHEGTFIVPEDSNRGFKIVFSGAEVKPGQRNLPKKETKSLLGQGQKILEDGKEAAKAAGLTVDEKLWVSSGNFVGDFDDYKPSKYMKSLKKGSKIRDRLNGKVQGAKGWAARQIQVMKSTGGDWDGVWMKTLETLRDGGFDAVDEAVKKKILPAAVVGILGYNLIEKEAKRDARSQDA